MSSRGSNRVHIAQMTSLMLAGSMSSFCPAVVDSANSGAPAGRPAAEDPRFPSLADYREQAQLLAAAGAELIVLEMIGAPGYGRAAVQAAAETGLPEA